MKELSLTRRHLLAGGAMLGAAAACCSLSPARALAAGGDIGVDARPEWDTAHTVCRACPNACGFTAYVVDGKLGKVIGDSGNPHAAGRLCSRGYGYTQSLYSDAAVSNPLKKVDGRFHTISWDEALSEVGDALRVAASFDGPGSVAAIYGTTVPYAENYANLLMNGLGSGNVAIDDVATDTLLDAACRQTLGCGAYHADIANADMVVLIDSSMADVTAPDTVAALQQARQAGTTIVAIDPRLGTLGSFAGEWYAVNPGTELALLLAVCRTLVANGRYDKDYVDANVAGMDVWIQSLEPYTAQWAQDVTGVEAFRIEELASRLHEAAPKVAIEFGNGRVGGAASATSAEAARVTCLLNALLGAYNETGGALLPFDYAKAVAAGGAVEVAGSENDLAEDALAGNAAAIMAAACEGAVRALVAMDADVAYDYASVGDIAAAAESMDVLVYIGREMNETAQLADYVLPLSSYLTVGALPELQQGAFPAAAMAVEAVAKADGDNSLPLGTIVDGIAQGGDLIGLPSEEVSATVAAQMEALGISLEGLAADGTASFEEGTVARVAAWGTPSKKIQVAQGARKDYTLDDMPAWIEPAQASNILRVMSADMNDGQADEVAIMVEGQGEEPRLSLITGQQPTLGLTGTNVAELMDIAKMYQLDSVWINSDVAQLLGIASYDTVLVHNDAYDCEATAFVTDRIVPTAAYLPAGFGRTSASQTVAVGQGANAYRFSSGAPVSGSNALCTQDACVRIVREKEGA